MDSWTSGAEGLLKTNAHDTPRGAIMADRVSVSITIGGKLSANRLNQLIELANDKNLSVDWDGVPFTEEDLPVCGPLVLRGNEITNAKLMKLKTFAVPTTCRSGAGQAVLRPPSRQRSSSGKASVSDGPSPPTNAVT